MHTLDVTVPCARCGQQFAFHDVNGHQYEPPRSGAA